MIGLAPTITLPPWPEKLRRLLASAHGARLGEATVVSRQVHLSDPATPHIVTLLTTADAGQTFYGRHSAGEIIHLDIFHAVANVDHRRIANALRLALAGIQPHGETNGASLVLDYFDLVTATGGGRVTGDLTHCQKESLRAAHRNHVHLAGRMTAQELPLLFAMVAAVEQEILAQGIEIRRLERLYHQKGGGNAAIDLSAYTDRSDSWLRPPKRSDPHGPSTRGVKPSEQPQQSLRSRGGAATAEGGQLVRGGDPTSCRGGEIGHDANGAQVGRWDPLQAEQALQGALALSRRIGSPDEVKRVLDELGRDQSWSSLYNSQHAAAPYLVRQLEEEGLVRRDVRGVRLTDAGRQLAAYLQHHLRDVKLRFRKLIRRMPAKANQKGPRPGSCRNPPSAYVRYGPIRGTAPAEVGTWLGDVAVPETIRAALLRTHLRRIDEATAPAILRLERRDVHVYLRSSQQPLHICLLIDASASMAGRRIQAAKHLARHLLASTRDRVAVIAFQERDVRVYVPFTRDFGQVEEGLARIQPLGLTPLAHGLTQSLDLIKQSRVRRPLLLLITDGIPTVPKWTIDPLSDALEAARQVGAVRIPFGCIGLQPSRRYLEELAKVAGGTLHVVEELDEDALVTIAHHERMKTAARGR